MDYPPYPSTATEREAETTIFQMLSNENYNTNQVNEHETNGKDSPAEADLESLRSDQDTALEDYAYNIYKKCGLLAEVKGQLVQFLENSGRLKMSNVKPGRANSEILQLIYEYLKWVGMNRSATLVASESPVYFDTSFPEGEVGAEESPKLVKMFTQESQDSQAVALKSQTGSDTFIVKPKEKTLEADLDQVEPKKTKLDEEPSEPEAFEIEEDLVIEEHLRKQDINSEKPEPPTESEKNEENINSEKAEPEKSESEKIEVDVPSIKFPEFKVLESSKYRDQISFDEGEEEQEDETKSYSETFEVESNVESITEEEQEADVKSSTGNPSASLLEPIVVADLKLEEKKSETKAQVIPVTVALPQESGNNKPQAQANEGLVTSGEDSMSSLMDNLTISENTEDVSINSDSIGITSCEHGVDLD